MTTPFDFESLTLDEVETIELIAGTSIDVIMDAGQPKGKSLKAIVFVINKRTNPDFTLEQAGSTKMVDINNMMAVDDLKKE
jgi:hypothetical protein